MARRKAGLLILGAYLIDIFVASRRTSAADSASDYTPLHWHRFYPIAPHSEIAPTHPPYLLLR